MPKDFSMYGDITNYPCSLVMSGVESDSYFDIAIGEDIDRMLMSFHYIQRKGKNFIRDRLSSHPNVKLMIDSGAHTFHAKEEEYRQKPLEFWEKYLDRYTKFLIANKEFIFSCVELDIAHLVGFDKVDYFREKYFEPLKAHGILVCYVWHDYDGDKHWSEMCEKYDYVGFSLVNSDMGEKDIIKKMNIARRYGTLVHGFAVTRVDIMSRVPFFTGDSTTWLVGTQYGELNWFDGRKMKRLKKEKWKYEYRQKYINIGANWELAGEENPYELIRINLIVFKQAEEYIRKRIRGKSYWFNTSEAPKPTTSFRNKSLPKAQVEKEEAKKVVKKKLKRKPKTEVIELEESTVEETPPTARKPRESAPPQQVSTAPPSKFEVYQATKEKEVAANLRDFDSQVEILPELDWFDGEMEDYKAVFQQLGINTNGNDKDFLIDQLYSLCIFTRDFEVVDNVETEQLFNFLKTYNPEISEDMERDEVISGCKKVVIDNLTLSTSSMFPKTYSMDMEAIERPKERDDYLEDEAFEMVDMSNEEMRMYLPEPSDDDSMPEVDELDKELSKSGVVAVRDEKGRFLKGQKKVRKPKQVYSDKFPKLACNTCYKAGDCPEFRPDSVCAYDKIFKNFDVRNMDDIMDAMQGMANLNLGRMQRMAMFEIMDGGMADGTVTSMIDQNMNLLMKMKQLQDQQAQIIATQRRTMRSDGSTEETTTVTNPTGGILAQIFGTPSTANDDEMDEAEVIEAEAEEISDEVK